MAGGAAGVGRRGGPAARDAQPDEIGGSWDYVRVPGNAYLWGHFGIGGGNITNVNLGMAGAGAAGAGSNMLRAVPHFFPRAGIIGKTGFFQGDVNGGTGRVRLGIYASGPTYYPAELLADSGDLGPWPDPAGSPASQWQTFTPNLEVEAMSVLWLAWMYSDQLRVDARSLWTYQASTGVPGLLGFHRPDQIPVGDTQYRIIPAGNAHLTGFRAPQTYGTMPGSFPTANYRPLFSNNSTTEGTTWFNRILSVGFLWTDA